MPVIERNAEFLNFNYCVIKHPCDLLRIVDQPDFQDHFLGREAHCDQASNNLQR